MLKSIIHFIVFILLFPSLSSAVTGKVVSIADGDTITILAGKTQHKIRLYGIDTPEKGQAFGNAAKKFTSKLVAGKTVDVEAYDTDKYGRTVGVVFANGVNVNQSLISAGLACSIRNTAKHPFAATGCELRKRPKKPVSVCGPTTTRYRLGTGERVHATTNIISKKVQQVPPHYMGSMAIQRAMCFILRVAAITIAKNV